MEARRTPEAGEDSMDRNIGFSMPILRFELDTLTSMAQSR